MPIRPEFRCFYGREWREQIRPRILTRAKNCCERCHKPDGAEIFTISGTDAEGNAFMLWRGAGPWINSEGWPASRDDLAVLADARWYRRRNVRVVLTVAHLNHTPGDDRDVNLKAMCQWCHLHHDKEHHRESRCKRKDAERPLLMVAS